MATDDKVTLRDGVITAYGKVWRTDEAFSPRIIYRGGQEVLLSSAAQVRTVPFHNGLGAGERTDYQGFAGRGDLHVETELLLNGTDCRLDCTILLYHEGSAPGQIEEVRYPAPLMAEGEGSYAVLNTMQGQLLPTDWPEETCRKLPFDGQMCSEAAYMPWWGEVTEEGAYLALVRSPWDTKYTISHPASGPNRIYARHLPSLGRMRYARTVSFYFFPAGTDYVDLCKAYRRMAEESGKAVTLREKAVGNPQVGRLVGSCVMHVDGKTHVTEGSRFYHPEAPEKNDRLVPFSHWAERVKRLKALGVERLYLHQDGWGQPGYDNQHPDYLPACRELGGWEGMKQLSDTLSDLGYLFGVHDQYRDYYLDAPTYTPDHACQSPDGSIYGHCIWAGGQQNYLCASLAPDYVRRNFESLFAHGIRLQATYLDVFTCNEADECANPRHPMTRRECLAARETCFRYLTAHGIAPSSEEVNDWAMPSQVFCHWAPYPGDAAIPVPLFNLVYHDCVMIPWKMEAEEWGIPKGTTGYLQCMLNGGMPYLSDTLEGEALMENIRQVQEIAGLHRRVAMAQMVSHRFVTEDRSVQETRFSDGTVVTVDFPKGTVQIETVQIETVQIERDEDEHAET